MFTFSNLFKTIVIALIVSVSFGFYESSTHFLLEPVYQQGFVVELVPTEKISRLDAFIEASRRMEPQYFWPHLLKQWSKYFAIIFLSSVMLLFIIRPPNKIKNENAASGMDAQKDARPF